MPDWAKTQKNKENSRNVVPVLSLNQSNGELGAGGESSTNGRPDMPHKPKKTGKKKQKKKKKKKRTSQMRSPSSVNGVGDDQGPPQHQLMFEDSFRWNRKNFDLPKRLTAAEKAAKREEKARKQREATAIAPADRAEALEQQVAQLR